MSVKKVLDVIREYCPDASIGYMNETWWGRLLPESLRRAVRTIWNRVYFYTRELISERVLAHEGIHIFDRSIPFIIKYLSPQIFGIVPLIFSIIGFATGLWQAALICLLITFILVIPWPAYYRWELEKRAYLLSLAEVYWKYRTIDPGIIDYIADSISGPIYYYMIWGYKNARKEVQKLADLVTEHGGKIWEINEPPFDEKLLKLYRKFYEAIMGF